MNKRSPVIASFLLFIVLCATAAYWALQLFQPAARPVAAPPRAAAPQIDAQAAAGLFGGQAGTATASNFQLRGVIYAGNPRESVAILSADGEPARAVRAGTEVVPGVIVKEVHRGYVLLTENGTVKRVDLPEEAENNANGALLSPVPMRPVAPPPQQQLGPRPPPAAASAPPPPPPAEAPGATPPPPTEAPGATPANGSAVPDAAANARMQRGFVEPQTQQDGGQGQVQLPPEAPPSVVVNPGAGQVAPQVPPAGN